MAIIDFMLSVNTTPLVGYCIVTFVLGVGSGFALCKLFKKCSTDTKCEPLIDIDAFWDPAASCGQVVPKKRKSKGKRKGK